MSKERDIQILCYQVSSMSPYITYGSLRDSTSCPFCTASVDYVEEELENLVHDNECAYLIARDLVDTYRFHDESTQ